VLDDMDRTIGLLDELHPPFVNPRIRGNAIPSEEMDRSSEGSIRMR
jgi:hypothetical protein